MHLLIQLTSNFHERRYYKVGRTVGGVTSIEGKQVNSSMPDIVICIYVRPFIGATEEVLEWFKYPCTSAHPRCKVSCQEVPNQLTLSLCLCFVEASPKVEKAVSCYKADWPSLVAKFPQRLSLAVSEFWAAGEKCCERGHRRVCVYLWCRVLLCLKHIRMITAV